MHHREARFIISGFAATSLSWIRRSCVTAAATLALAACSGATPQESTNAPGATAPYEGPVVAPSAIPHDFLWEQEVTASHGEQGGSFRAVVQKQHDTLTVLGLTPFGTRAFALIQRGTNYEFERFVPFELPFDPRAVLIDIHRCFFAGLFPTSAEGHKAKPAPKSGSTTQSLAGELVEDTWADSRLVRRSYRRPSDAQPLVIRFEGRGFNPSRLDQPPPTVTLENPWYGYELRVETLNAESLEAVD